MDSMSAFMRGQAARASGARQMVFDWHKAAKRIKEVKPTNAYAGLAGDWEWTGGRIYEMGRPTPERQGAYLSSNWATPELEMDGVKEDCFTYEDETPGWNEHTHWPKSALKILKD